MQVLKPLTLTAAIAAVALSTQVAAYDAGDIIVRAGATTVAPNDDSSGVTLNGASLGPNSGVSVDDDTQLGLTATYMFSKSWGIELLAATPFSHSVKGEGVVLGGIGDIAEVDHLPPTLSAVYHFDTEGPLQPYVGLGINYTTFFSEEASSSLEAALGNASVSLDDSWGLAGQIGLDWHLNDKWLVNASARYIDIETDATITLKDLGNAKVKTSVDIDPYVYTVAIGYKF